MSATGMKTTLYGQRYGSRKRGVESRFGLPDNIIYRLALIVSPRHARIKGLPETQKHTRLSQSLISLCERLLTERPAQSTFNLKVE
jgi:hypothetical protein